MEESTAQLMRRVSHGDAAAFEVVYDRYAAQAMGLVVHVLGGRRDADEVLQEAFWKIWSSASRYDPERGDVTVWIMVIVRSVAIDALRKRRRDAIAKETIQESLRGDTEVADNDPRPDIGNNTDQRSIARGAFDALPAEQRELLGLSFYRGLSHSQIADIQALPIGTVKTRIRNGMMKLRELATRRASEVPTP